MADVIAFATENPGGLTFSGAGLFVGHHIAALQLEKAAGVKLAYIPNNAGGAGAMRAVISGEVMGGVNNLSDAFRAQAAGNVKILGVFDLERNAFLPDTPTMKEQGYDIDNSSVNFRGVMVPKGTPQPIIDHLAAVVPTMFENGRVQSRMEAGGSPMQIMTRDEHSGRAAVRSLSNGLRARFARPQTAKQKVIFHEHRRSDCRSRSHCCARA